MTSNDKSRPMHCMSYPILKNTSQKNMRDHDTHRRYYDDAGSSFESVNYSSSYNNGGYAPPDHHRWSRPHHPENYGYYNCWPRHHRPAQDWGEFSPLYHQRRSPAAAPSFGSYHSSSSRTPEQLPEDFMPPRHPFLAASGGGSFPSTPANVTPNRPTRGPNDTYDSSSDGDGSAGRGGVDHLIWELRDNDIVCGRGAPTNYQQGNEIFRDIVADYQTMYLCSKRSDKPKIAMELQRTVRARGGRFVRRVKTTLHLGRFGWEEINEKRAYEKVCQALREGAPALRRKMLASTAKLQQQKVATKRREEDDRTPSLDAGYD